jgi:hypothetical protein
MKEQLFTKLNKVIDLKKLKNEGYLKYVSSGYMDLNLDVVDYNKQHLNL